MKTSHRLPVVSLLLLLPASSLITFSVIGFNVPPALFHPVLVMGGLIAALVMNLAATLSFNAEREGGHLAALNIRIGTKPLNLVLVGISALLLLTLLGYAFVENFRPR